MQKRTALFLIFSLGFLLLSIPIHSQVIYTPITSNVYNFLGRIADKGIIENYFSMVKPLSRNEIAGYLKEIEKKSSLLSEVERKELKWYEDDYSYELYGKFNRWRLFEYADTLFRVYITPVVDLQYKSIGGEKNYKRGWLGRFDGSIGNSLGFSFYITDNSEWGDTVDAMKTFTPLTGFNYKKEGTNSISYEDINATLNYSWSWGEFTLGKDYINWGSGTEGQLILSSKAPSFPFIKFDIRPVSWLRFQYIHGWLASNIPDSASIYTSTDGPDGKVYYRTNQRSKYIAANFLSIIPWKNFIFSLGNSIIYSDGGIRIPFLIPFIWYYKGIDHNFYGSTEDDGYGNNGQLFFDLSVRSLKNFHFYSTFFIDEISFTEFLKGGYAHNQTGYTIGMSNYSSLINNLKFKIEYSKIMPGTYLNHIQTQTYAHDSYTLGDWIGQNADYLYTGFDYELRRGMNIGAYYKKIRKGGNQLGTDYLKKGTLTFLYKPLSEYNIFGINYSYEPLYDLNIKAYLDYVKYSYDSGTAPVTKKNNTDFGLSVSYGIY